MLLSIIVPFYDEASTLGPMLDRLVAVAMPADVERELVLVDDGSTDASRQVAQRFVEGSPLPARLLAFDRNAGKGHAVRAGLGVARGDLVIIQDGDLENDPTDMIPIVERFRDPRTTAVYGSRILGATTPLYRPYYLGGRFLSAWTNLLFRSRITDEPTCYKCVRREVLVDLPLRAERFEICPEMTGWLLRRGHRIREVPIRYTPRSFDEGKKVRPRDGIVAAWVLFAIRFGLRRPAEGAARTPRADADTRSSHHVRDEGDAAEER